jgi:hypothetical protein
MSSPTVFEIARTADNSHPLFVEKYSWVDEKLSWRMEAAEVYGEIESVLGKRMAESAHEDEPAGKKMKVQASNKRKFEEISTVCNQPNKRRKLSHDM